MISVETVIDAPPEVVREIVRFPDAQRAITTVADFAEFGTFSSLHDWHTSGWISSVESTTAGKVEGMQLAEGDKMRSRISGMTFNQTVLVNTPREFRWVGPWYGLLTGTHAFEWNPVPGNPNQTRAVQWERFTGILAWSMNSPTSMGGKKTRLAFEAVNADLKLAAETKWKKIQAS